MHNALYNESAEIAQKYPKESFISGYTRLVPKQAEVFAASIENPMSHKIK